MEGESIYAIITSITTIIGPIVTWFLTKRKYGAEVDTNVISNMRESLEFYKQLSDDMKRRLEESLQRSAKLEQEVNDLRKQVMTLSMMLAGYGLEEKMALESNVATEPIENTTKSVDKNN